LREIYKKLGTDSVVVEISDLYVSTDKGLRSIRSYFPTFNGDVNLVVIPVMPSRVYRTYFKQYILDWSRIHEDVNAILDLTK
jgi:hypothetical protein